jgi:hypothetical protein
MPALCRLKGRSLPFKPSLELRARHRVNILFTWVAASGSSSRADLPLSRYPACRGLRRRSEEVEERGHELSERSPAWRTPLILRASSGYACGKADGVECAPIRVVAFGCLDGGCPDGITTRQA